jgi:hypothetical protein
MLCELLAELFGRDRNRLPLRTFSPPAPEPPEREHEADDLEAGWCGFGPAGTAPTEGHSGVTEYLVD